MPRVVCLTVLMFVLAASPALAVINGTVVADPHRFPWSVALQLDVKHGQGRLCAASLVAPSWVLTARHCLLKQECASGARAVVSVGTTYAYVRNQTFPYKRNPRPDGVKRTVDRWKVPADDPYVYSESDQAFLGDIALLHLDKPVKNVPVLTLGTADGLPPNKAAWIVGHGATGLAAPGGTCENPNAPPAGKGWSEKLREGKARWTSSSNMFTYWGSALTATGASQHWGDGDSGGPVMLHPDSNVWTQIAVINSSPLDGVSSAPAIRVDRFWRFINDTVGRKTVAPPPSQLAGLQARLKMRRSVGQVPPNFAPGKDPCRRKGSYLWLDQAAELEPLMPSSTGWTARSESFSGQALRLRLTKIGPAANVLVGNRDGSDVQYAFAKFQVAEPAAPQRRHTIAVESAEAADRVCVHRSAMPVGGTLSMPAVWSWEHERRPFRIGGRALITLTRTGKVFWDVDVALLPEPAKPNWADFASRDYVLLRKR